MEPVYRILTWILIGLAAGFIARWLMPGKIRGGFIVTIILGIVGAFVGGFICYLLGIGGGNIIAQILIAACGAVVALIIYDFLRRRGIFR